MHVILLYPPCVCRDFTRPLPSLAVGGVWHARLPQSCGPPGLIVPVNDERRATGAQLITGGPGSNADWTGPDGPCARWVSNVDRTDGWTIRAWANTYTANYVTCMCWTRTWPNSHTFLFIHAYKPDGLLFLSTAAYFGNPSTLSLVHKWQLDPDKWQFCAQTLI